MLIIQLSLENVFDSFSTMGLEEGVYKPLRLSFNLLTEVFLLGTKNYSQIRLNVRND